MELLDRTSPGSVASARGSGASGGGLLVSMARELFDDVATSRSTTQLEPGDVLIEAGEIPSGLFLVQEGAFEVTVGVQDRQVVMGTLGPGEIVGEVSLFAGGRATATVTASESSMVQTITVPVARDWLSLHPDVATAIAAEGRERIDRNELTLLLSELTGSTDPEVIGESLALCAIVRLEGGQTLFHQGEHADAAYIVITGRLSVWQVLDGEPCQVGRLGRGQIVGETGLFERAPARPRWWRSGTVWWHAFRVLRSNNSWPITRRS
ncbi:MAG TPA: cyclic nucleotide-binding domain-containing protein [Acidimicrobiia bacterium]|nr:cyclic nucleotide-binding domain-containing protein [Acidimicrobiia bacterium]